MLEFFMKLILIVLLLGPILGNSFELNKDVLKRVLNQNEINIPKESRNCINAILNTSLEIKNFEKYTKKFGSLFGVLESKAYRFQRIPTIHLNTPYFYDVNGLARFIGTKTNVMQAGPGLYASKDPLSITGYGNNLIEMFIKPDSKVFHVRNNKITRILSKRPGLQSCNTPKLKILLNYNAALENNVHILSYVSKEGGWFNILHSEVIDYYSSQVFSKNGSRKQEVADYFFEYLDYFLKHMQKDLACHQANLIYKYEKLIEKYCEN